MALLLAALLGGAAAEARPRYCEFNYPIAGSAGYANAQVARATNTNTYSAAAFAERTGRRLGMVVPNGQGRSGGFGYIAAEMNWTFGAARVPTYCADTGPGTFDEPIWGGDPMARHAKRERVYEEPLDLYATNATFGFGTRTLGAFYSAAVTQSVLGYRAWAVPAQLMNVHPVFFAPLVGNYQRGDGVASYGVDWIGGAYLDTAVLGARAGYTGARGFYTSVDERFIGLFGTTSLGGGARGGSTPWSYLRAGVQRFTLRRYGMHKIANQVGMSSVFLRDLPIAGGTDATEALAAAGEDRFRTLHVQQQSIAGLVDVELAANLGQGGLFEGHVAVHTPGFHPEPQAVVGAQRRRQPRPSKGAGALVKLGAVTLPPRYTLGVEGGTYFSARADFPLGEAHEGGGFMVSVLFNDPEQLSLYPFAVNALSIRASALYGSQ
jgi:hypothetical protein